MSMPLCPILLTLSVAASVPQASETLVVRGKPQTLHLYGTRGAPTAVVASGDGGWIHLGPLVATYLAAKGWFIVGFDCKSYLSQFTSKSATLKPEDVPGDVMRLAEYAARGARGRPLLIGVSEGAGLSVLAATEPSVRDLIGGVVGLGLGERNELGWRLRDSVIYLTHGVPNEPTFSSTAVVGRVAPLPLAVLNSTHDDFVPLEEIRRIMAQAKQPSRLWLVESQNHNFDGNVAGFQAKLGEALAWIESEQAKRP
jgi:hypothetical protein